VFPDHRTEQARRLSEEHARSHSHLKRWHEQNPGFLDDPDAYLEAHGRMTDAQLEDLKATGAPLSANPTATEIHDAHLHMRAHAPHRVRSAEQLIGHVARRLTPPRRAYGTFKPVKDGR
jgi:hypothetical protein